MAASGMRWDGTDSLGAGLLLVGLLACFAGIVDALGLSILNDLFVSFMSGNTTSLGLAIGRHDLPRALLIVSLIGTFVAGATIGTVLAHFAGRFHLPALVGANAVTLSIPILFPDAQILSMTFAMGLLNAAMDHAGSVRVSITYITGTLVQLGRGIGLSICGRQRGFAWLGQAVPWIGMLIGASVGTIALVRFGSATTHWLPVVALVLALIALIAVPTTKASNAEMSAMPSGIAKTSEDEKIRFPSRTGLPFYSAIAPFAGACFLITLVTDIAYWATDSFLWETGSVWLLTIGLVIGGLAVLAAIVDLARGGIVKVLGARWPTLTGHAAAFMVCLVNVFVHSRDGYTAVVPEGLILSAIAVIILIISAIAGRLAARSSRIGGLA